MASTVLTRESTSPTELHALPPAAVFPAAPAFVIVLLLVLSGPQFVCMPLTNDTAYYDLQAKNLLDGGVLYRDMLEPNLPGVVWFHAIVRSLLGWRSETLRVVDLLLFGVSSGLLAAFLRRQQATLKVSLWTAAMLLLFYLSQSEWSHTQRDLWMLAPAAAGLLFRERQLRRMREPEPSGRSLAGWAFLEGTVWGIGVWIKPYVAIMGLACWLVSALGARRLRPVLTDALGLLCGGLLLGAAGVGWLMQSGAWPYFLETMRDWNPRYFSAGKEHWTTLRYLAMSYRFFPWNLFHSFAVPVAITSLWRYLAKNRSDEARPALLGAFYLAWLGQAYILQHLYDYVHAPTIVLACCVLAVAATAPGHSRFWKPAFLGFVLLAVTCSPILKSERLRMWPNCVTRGSTPEVRHGLAGIPFPDWLELEQAAAFLRRQNLRDGELTCFNNDLVYLYQELDVRPSSRYVYLEAHTIFFPDRREQILREVMQSRQKFVVSDLRGSGMSAARARRPGENGANSLPEGFPDAMRQQFPWNQPVVFRAGSILVHAANPASPVQSESSGLRRTP